MSDVNLSISKEVVQPIIEAKIHAAVCEALSGSANIVSEVVTKILNQKVEKDTGKVPGYSSNSDMPYIQWLCTEAVKNAAKESIIKFINSSNDKLVKAIEAVLKRDTNCIAQNLVNSFIESTKNHWTMKVDVSVASKE